MRRRQLFELNDLTWVPPSIRESIVETLSRTLSWGSMLSGLVAPFQAFLREAETDRVLDLCCGAGGPAAVLTQEFSRAGLSPPHFLLADLHPQASAWERVKRAAPGNIDYVPESVDATRIPPELTRGRARAIINAFHHFPPELAQRIVDDAIAQRAPLFISEAFDRNPVRFASFAPVGIPAVLANPLLTPEPSFGKVAVTWLSPLLLAASVWDGVVSTLRIYEESDLRRMVAGSAYRWSYGRYAYKPWGRGYYFYGVPS